jgi:hypothetical protein
VSRGLLAIAVTLLTACGTQRAETNQSGRFQQITNPNPPECGGNPPNNCGITILDTQTGTVFTRERSAWWEENPQTGRFVIHNTQFVPQPK